MNERTISDFLGKMGLEKNIWYKNMDDVYVAPIEFSEINSLLSREKIVILTGTKEYGKTFTAIKLLWEYYKNGYEPRYVQTQYENKAEVRHKLVRIENTLEKRHIIYFEDPFGKLDYQSDEDLERDIGALVDTVRGLPDTYVVITSREEVFKEFNRRRISDLDLTKFEIKLNMKTPSYDYERRKEMIIRCAKVLKCRWVSSNKLTNFVLEYVQDPGKLSSPLKIRDFAISTIEVDIKDELEKQILSKSKETAMSFAEEFKMMSDDKTLFLLLLYTSDRFQVSLLESKYYQLATQLGIQRLWSFSRILDWFSVDKVLRIGSSIRISHGSYSEGLEYLLHENGDPSTLSSGMFTEILLDLVQVDDIFPDILDIIIKNIEFLPPKFVQILKDRLGKQKARRCVFESIFARKRFYNWNSPEILSREDKFFLSCVLKKNLDVDSILPDDKFLWSTVWKNILDVEQKFKESVSEKILSVICSSPKLTSIETPYYEKMFHDLIEFRIKKIVRAALSYS